MPKSYKKKIKNYFIKSASWIDTTFNADSSLRYQQTLFNLSEIYTRRFRKLVYENRRKLVYGRLKIEELNAMAMTDYSKRRVEYDIATDFGRIDSVQKVWEQIIRDELNKLQSFSNE